MSSFCLPIIAQTTLGNGYSTADLPTYLVVADNTFEPENVTKKDPYYEVTEALKDYLDDELDVRSRTHLLNAMDKLGFELEEVVIRGTFSNNVNRIGSNNTDFNNFFVFVRKE